jgi:hypothetical protein
MWNGYAADCGAAIATCKETWTDDRVWYPFGINIRYGPQQKTRLQAISDHCIPLDNGKKTIIRDERKEGDPKPKLVVYKTHDYFVKRVEELREHAKATGHQKAFQKALDEGDAEGKTLLIHAAIKNNIRLTDFLIENGIDVNLLTNRGGSAHHFASEHSDKTLVGKLIDAGAKYKDGYGVEEPLPIKHTFNDYIYFLRAMIAPRINDIHMRDMRINHMEYANLMIAPRINDIHMPDMRINDMEYEFKINDKDLPKKKKRAHDEKLANPPPRVKASLFKKQFGRK